MGLWPEIWGKHRVGLLQSFVCSSAEVFSGTSLTDTTGVDIIDTSELEDLLGNLSCDTTSTSWGWDHSNGTRSALSLNLGWDGMDITDSGTPVTSSNWDHSEFGINKGTLDGNLDFLSDLDSNTNVSVSITDGADSLESGSLTGLGLLLDGEDAHDIIGEDLVERLLVFVLEKEIDDLGLLDWDGSGVHLLEGLNLAHADESTQLGEWGPLITLSSSTGAATAATSSSTTASIATAAASSETTTSWSVTAFGWCWGCCWCFHVLVKNVFSFEK